MPAQQDRTGTVALVTGASRGIGAAIAQALAARGTHVILTARDSAALEAVEDSIHESGGTATIAPLDLAQADAVPRLAAAVAERWRRLDTLVINAAYLPLLTAVADLDQKEFTKALTTNVVASQALLASFHPLLRQAAAGRVVGLTSSVGSVPRAFWGGYGASKAAFEMLLDCYALETERLSAIKVAIVDPGATATAMRTRAFPGEDPATLKRPEVVGAAVADLLDDDFENRLRIRVDGSR
ncbi:SDR family NAD(P)-dependent oxidoreductase [Erythrobacteraceae bacterium CFH 75059]|uniref:SDR family NAD(P)-dependent oxidoreductase n=1 Tax=Qipengyuania thermophila TaxID=2509361 RepID=UPI001020BFE6|nr:SDR family NAD(P)-dependent oxidoreductase [Qipengyuania thermophila]TCD05336.1 SDR family NAD(P)-dependent oxidoreductase [Erythrobacteraceae bacterium CFH 75059]